MTRSSSHDCDEWTAITQEEKMEDVQITQSTNDNLVEQRNVTMDASLLLWHGLRHQREFCSILSCYPTGPEPQTQMLLMFSLKEKKIGGVEYDKVPERPFASEVKCCCCTLCLIVPHIIQLDSRTLALVDKNDVSDCIETNSEIGVDWFSSVRAVGKMTLAKALLKRRRQAQYCGHCQNKWLFLTTVL